MPTVLRQAGFSFRIYPNDHAPAHVHAVKAEGTTIINLGDLEAQPSIREAYKAKPKEQRDALAIATGNQNLLLEKWAEIHSNE
ncbi:MAG: DUF4160 domain-containing protein [Pyrinomonadaceae bacterium MAG19_C2-C3]|nr:DUF4160 domain-containing protein [Pyrinomonadaceae bacterium MAG19_C2-C3]